VAGNEYGTKTVEFINIASPTVVCQKLPDLPITPYFSTGGIRLQGSPFVCFGYDCYNWIDNQWIPGLSSPTFLYYVAAAGYHNIFVYGGIPTSAALLTSSGWVKQPDPPEPLFYSCAVQISADTYMVIGGFGNNETVTSNTYFYHSKSQLWEKGPSLQEGRYFPSCGLIKGENNTMNVIVVGGAGQTILNSSEILDSGSSVWRAGPTLPASNAASALIQDGDGGVIIIGGADYSGSSTTSLYHLANLSSGSQWVKMQQHLKVSRYGLTAFLVPENITNCS